MKSPLIYIVLVNYKDYRLTQECVESLRKVNYKNFKVIIVDNYSQNESVEMLKTTCSDCIVIDSDKNLGWAGGNNLGIEYGLKNNGEYFLLLNNDTEVEPDFLDKMMEPFVGDEKMGIVGNKIMYFTEKNKIWYGGGRVNWMKYTSEHFGILQEDSEEFNVPKEVTFITGCSMLIKKEVFDNVGLIPEEYFMYFEDNDYCTRVLNYGYKLFYQPTAVIYHKVSASSGGEDSAFSLEWMTRNIFIFMDRYKEKSPAFIISRLYRKLAVVKKYFVYTLKKDNARANAVIKGYKAYKDLKRF